MQKNDTLKPKEAIIGDTVQHLQHLNDNVERKRLFFVSRLCKMGYNQKALVNAIVDTVINDNITDAVILYPEPIEREKYINPRAVAKIRSINRDLKALAIDVRLHLISLDPKDFINAVRKKRAGKK